MTFAAVAFLYLRSEPPAAPPGLRWLVPTLAEGASYVEAPALELKPALAFDGDRSTSWAYLSEGSKDEGELTLAFPGMVLLSGLVVETGGFQSEEAVSSAAAGHQGVQSVSGSNHEVVGKAKAQPSDAAFPKSLVLEVEGRKPLRFNLSEGMGPQFLNLGWVMADKVRLRFASSRERPAAIREIRFLGLPYE
jgi:hypothetical protein